MSTRELPPEPRRRDLAWPGCYNVRDLGGLPTADGGVTRRGVIVRADVLSRLTAAGRHALLDYGVRTIIDLRGPDEVRERPSTFSGQAANPAAPRYLHLPLDRFEPDASARIARAASRAEVYSLVLDHYPDAVAAIIRAVLAVPLGTVVIHCHSGKDRTGLIAALLLSVAGVPRELIVADYALSQARLWPHFEQIAAEAGGEDKVSGSYRPVAPPESMRDTLAHLDAIYGSVYAYLRHAGLTDAELAALRARLRDA